MDRPTKDQKNKNSRWIYGIGGICVLILIVLSGILLFGQQQANHPSPQTQDTSTPEETKPAAVEPQATEPDSQTGGSSDNENPLIVWAERDLKTRQCLLNDQAAANAVLRQAALLSEPGIRELDPDTAISPTLYGGLGITTGKVRSVAIDGDMTAHAAQVAFYLPDQTYATAWIVFWVERPKAGPIVLIEYADYEGKLPIQAVPDSFTLEQATNLFHQSLVVFLHTPPEWKPDPGLHFWDGCLTTSSETELCQIADAIDLSSRTMLNGIAPEEQALLFGWMVQVIQPVDTETAVTTCQE